MDAARRATSSAYMRWAKTRSRSRYNLAASGMPGLSLADLPGAADAIALSGPDSENFTPLREAIAARYGASPENVVTAAGTSMANHLAMAALVEPGDELLVEDPVYEPISTVASYLGAVARPLPRRPENDWRVDPEELARIISPRTRLVVLTNLHNPSSGLLDEETLVRIGRIAERAGARVVVDEVYLGAAFEQAPRTAFHLGPAFVVTNSLTKVYGLSGLRCGWVLADAETAQRMWLLNDLFGVNAAHPAEGLSVLAFEHLDRIGERTRALLEANRRRLHAFYDTRDDLEAPRFAWGTTSFPRVTRGDVARLCEILRERYETTVVPGAFFGRDDRIRIGLTCDEETFAAGLVRLASALEDISRG